MSDPQQLQNDVAQEEDPPIRPLEEALLPDVNARTTNITSEEDPPMRPLEEDLLPDANVRTTNIASNHNTAPPHEQIAEGNTDDAEKSTSSSSERRGFDDTGFWEDESEEDIDVPLRRITPTPTNLIVGQSPPLLAGASMEDTELPNERLLVEPTTTRASNISYTATLAPEEDCGGVNTIGGWVDPLRQAHDDEESDNVRPPATGVICGNALVGAADVIDGGALDGIPKQTATASNTAVSLVNDSSASKLRMC